MSEQSGHKRYAAFISYSHSDEKAAARLHRTLERFKIPNDIALRADLPASRRRIAPVFRDREELSSSPDLSQSIRAALADASALIVICSPRAKVSRWVNEEIKVFKRMRGESRVFAFLIEGEPGEAFPPALVKKLGTDGDLSDVEGEPLAADIRPGKDGWRVGALKIAAALLDVGLDALRQRELQRERRRMMAWTGGSLGVAAGASGLAAWAVLASMEADRMRARAEREAQTAQRTADFLVDLFEVPDPGESRGRQVTAKEILDKGVARIEDDLKGEPAVQGALMYTMGRTYTGLGLYPEAARILNSAVSKRIETAAAAEDVYAAQNALARAQFEHGDLEAAKALYEKLVDEAEADIAKGGWRIAYATALIGMGEVVYYSDKPDVAQPYYERARDLLEAHELNDTEELAAALQGLGGVYVELGAFDSAAAALQQALSIQLRLDPGDYRAVFIQNDLAYAYYRRGDLSAAIRMAEAVYDASKRILGEDHPEATINENNLARYRFEAGRLDLAQASIQSVLRRFKESNREQHFDYVFPVNTAAEIDLERGDTAKAATGFREALALAKDNGNRLFGPINFNLGRALCASGEVRQGLTYVESGRTALKEHYPLDDWRYAAADEFESRCRQAMGESETARALAQSAYARFQGKLGHEHFFTQRSKKWLDELHSSPVRGAARGEPG